MSRDMFRLVLTITSLLVASLFAAVGNGALTTVLGVHMDQMGLPTSRIGQVQAAFPLGLALGALFGHRLIEAFGHIRAYGVFAAVFIMATLLHVHTNHVGSWAALRLLEGCAFCGILMTLESWINDRADNRWRGGMFSIYMLVSYLGVTFGQFFLNIPQSTVFATIALFPVFSLIPVGLCRIPQPEIHRPKKMSVRVLLKKTPFAFGCSFTSGLLIGSFYSLGPVFARRAGLDMEIISYFMSVTILGDVFFQWPLGRLSDFLGRRRILMAMFATTALCAVLVPMAVTWPLPALLSVMLFYGAASFSIYPLSVAHANDWLLRSEMVAASGGFVLTQSVGCILSPIITSGLMELPGKENNLFYFFSVVALSMIAFGALRMMLHRRRRHRPSFFKAPLLTLPSPSGLASAAPYAITSARMGGPDAWPAAREENVVDTSEPQKE